VSAAQAATAGRIARPNGFGKPERMKAIGLGGSGERATGLRCQSLIQPQAEPRKIRRHFRPGSRAQMPPGRGAVLASEKCTCTTRQSPASLRNTIVEREMNATP
jgi:hypothetical protein